MKRNRGLLLCCFSAFAAIAAVSCQKQDVAAVSNDKAEMFPVNPFRVTLSDVADYASQRVVTKSAGYFDVEPILNGGDTVMYLVNYEKGWEVLSGDRRAPQVLMLCDSGKVTVDGLRFNEAQSAWLDGNEEGIKYLLENPDYEADVCDEGTAEVDTKGSGVWTLVTVDYVTASDSVYRDHLLETKWGQESPWNVKMPYRYSTAKDNLLAGCVPVAWGQLLYYCNKTYGLPVNSYVDGSCSAALNSTSSTAYVVLKSSDVSFRWNAPVWSSMSKTKTDGTSAGYEYVSLLLLRLGYLFGSKYYIDRTGTIVNSDMVQTIVDEYSLGSKYLDYDKERVISSVSGKMPVLATVSCDAGAHAVVIDGYRKVVTNRVNTYVRGDDNAQIETKKEIASTTTSDYFAINWGWDGTGDSSDGSTIWYNADENWSPVSKYTFTSKGKIFCNFMYRSK